MVCRRIVKANITNVDVVTEPANQHSKFVVAKSAAPRNGIAGAVKGVWASLVHGHHKDNTEYETVDAEPALYDFAYILHEHIKGIMNDNDIPAETKKGNIDLIMSEYKDAITAYLFSGDAMEGEGVRDGRSLRLAAMQKSIDAMLSADKEELLDETRVVQLEGAEGSGDGQDNSVAGATELLVTDEAADTAKARNDVAAEHPIADGSGQDSGCVADGCGVEQLQDGNATACGDANTVKGTGADIPAIPAGESNGENISVAGAADEQPSIKGLVGEQVEIAKSESLLAKLMAQIEAKETELAKANIRSKTAKFAILGIGADSMTDVFYELSKAKPSEFQSLMDRLEMAANAFEKSSALFDEIGKNNPSMGQSATAQAESMAKAMAAKEGLDMAQARGRVWTENPSLYQKYLKETGGKY